MESRQCWAHHPDGHRCHKKATHRGDHAWSITWTEEQCAGQPLIKVLADEPPIPVDQPIPLLPKPKCIACSHIHQGECKCGCKEYIG
jgi:hypothetical protein